MRKRTYLTMRLFTPNVTTATMTNIYAILDDMLPSIYHSRCYNDESLPFSREIMRTEIGHLFEHVILEYLCHYKLEEGAKSATYSGMTQWNWNKEKRGLFHISLNTTVSDIKILLRALDRSIALLEYIFKKNTISTQKGTSPFQPNFGFQTQSIHKN